MASTKRTARIGTAEQDDYQAFLQAKIALAPSIGVDVDAGEINPALRPHCKPIVQWALRGGCRAIFASFGLHKTTMQIEIMRLLGKKKGVRRLIVLPLGVRQEFMRDAAERFKGRFKVRLKFIRSADELEPEGKDDPIYLTNYETVRDGRLDPNIFGAASLDEASVLRSYGTKTYHEFLRLFADVTFKFVATATPSPNRYKELIHYAGFLGIMDTGLALTRFFQRDSTSANNLTLYPHKEDEFWLWMHSWAIFIQKPSDLGFSDEGYDLPPLDVRYHEVATDHSRAGVEKDGQHLMFKDAALGVTQAASEKRESLTRRVAKMREIIAADPREHMLLWHDLEDERRAIEAAVPTSVSVFGAQDLETREENVIAFSEGKLQYLATKPELSGSGCNFQRHCHTAVFLGIGFKFNDFIQAIHRVQRFGQTKPCRIHLIYTEAEREVLRVLRAKWARHEEMMKRMSEIIRKYGLDHIEMSNTLKRSIGVKRVEVSSDRYKIANNDCVLEARLQAENSVDLIVTSVPFSNHYEYTDKYEDFGHTDNNDHFWHQMDFLTPELFRILKPGRLACIHVKDRILFGNVTGSGAPTVSPFHAETIFHMKKHGFDFMGMITIVTDVVRENNQTYRLTYSEMAKDHSKMGVGSPEYVLLFHKPQTDRRSSYADTPITKSKADYTVGQWQIDAAADWRTGGNRLLSSDELAALDVGTRSKLFAKQLSNTVYDYDAHVALADRLAAARALPGTFASLMPGSWRDDVWTDILRIHTLNSRQRAREVEAHICPFPLDIPRRLIRMYSNPGELVGDPFSGLGSTVLEAVKQDRRGFGSELNPVSVADSVVYLTEHDNQRDVPTLFDLLDTEWQAA